jgi:hypothetical protein
MSNKQEVKEGILKRYETYIAVNSTPIFLKENVLKAMEEYASLESKGMRWVKASEPFPLLPERRVHIMYKGEPNIIYSNQIRWLWFGYKAEVTEGQWEHIEYLDESTNSPKEEPAKERFTRPTDKQVVGMALLVNDGKIEKEKLTDMVALADMIIDRLYENGSITIPSSKEK